MASSKLNLLHVLPSGKLSLPTLSLALLTGFTFSIILPASSLHPLFPAIESLFLVSLPHLWQASLSWFTPPCLFLLLNGIIMILTATSAGRFSSPPPSESPTNSLAKMEKFSSNNGVSSTGQPLAAILPPIEPDIDGATAEIDPPSLPVLRLTGPIVSFSKVPLCYHCLHAQDAAMEELEFLKDANCHEDFLDANSSDADGDDDDKNVEDMPIIFKGESQRALPIVVDRPAALNDHCSDDPASSLTCEEAPKTGSEPSTPKYSSPAMKDNVRRSLSVDCAPYIDDIEESPEYKLSEEAFKKRIEDYIFKVNAKLRSETMLI